MGTMREKCPRCYQLLTWDGLCSFCDPVCKFGMNARYDSATENMLINKYRNDWHSHMEAHRR